MTETITESFCERCGTRYEFEAPRLTTMRKTRGLIGGLRNYLTSQDALSDAMNDAMRTEEESLAAVQLDAFHSSFSFCIDCRQYTCTNCWNNTAGRCRSCVPIPGTDDLTERLAASGAADADPTFVGASAVSVEPVEAWPTSDLPTEVEGWPGADAFPAEPEPPVAETPALVADVETEPGTELAALDDAGWIVGEAPPEPEHWPDSPVAEPEPQPAVAAEEPEPVRPPLRVVAWDEDGTFETVEPEPEPVVADFEPELEAEPIAAEVEPEPDPVVADVEPEPEPAAAEVEPEPMVAEEVEPEPVAAEVEPEAEPIAAEVEPESEPVAAEVEPEPEPVSTAPPIPPIHETILHFPSRQAPPPTQSEDDRAAAMAESPEVAARRTQLDNLGLGDPGEGPVAAQQRPLPYRSRGAGVSSEELARAAQNASFWAASARAVAAATGHVGVQNCGQCGLSLSANARFCRRCGTRQARSA